MDQQKTVADATSTIAAASRTYAQDQIKNATADKEAIAEQLKKQMSPEELAYVNSLDKQQKDVYFSSSADYSAALFNEKAVTKEWGMGGDSSRALNAVTIAITGALGGQTDLQTASNALAPYAAQVIGEKFGHGEDKNTTAQMVSHAILGATLAYVNGGNLAAGGTAAVASEAAANYFANQYKDDPRYQNEKGEFIPNLLPEDVKTQIRDLTAAIGAVAGGTVGDSVFNAQLAGVVGQNAVENNEFFKVNDKGDFIACFEVFGLSCSPRQGERAATEQDIRNGAINIAIDVATGTIVGRAVKVVKNGYQIADKVFKNVKDASKAIDNSALSSVQKQQLKEQLAQQAGIPRDIFNNPASVWGKSINQIKQSFEMDGAVLELSKANSKQSGKAIAYNVKQSASGIKQVQYHPGNGIHEGDQYYKIVKSDGTEIRIFDPVKDKDFKPGTITSKQIYMNQKGQVLQYTTNNGWSVK